MIPKDLLIIQKIKTYLLSLGWIQLASKSIVMVTETLQELNWSQTTWEADFTYKLNIPSSRVLRTRSVDDFGDFDGMSKHRIHLCFIYTYSHILQVIFI